MKVQASLKSASSMLILFFILISCAQKQSEESKIISIDLDQLPADQIEISKLIKDIRVIPLETTPESMLGSLAQLEHDNSNIFYHSNQDQTIYRFSAEGKFLNKFCHLGKGPGEYSKIRNMQIVPGTETLMVSDVRQRKMIQYDFMGNLIREFMLPSSTGMFRFLENGIIALHLSKMHSFVNDSICNDLVFLDMEGNIISRQFFHNTPLQFAFGDPFTRPNEDGTYYYTRQFDYNLYSLKDTSLPEIAYEIDYGKYKGKIDELEGSGIEAFSAFQKKGKVSRIDGLVNSTEFLAIMNLRQRKASMLLFDKKSQKILTMGTDSLNNIGYLSGFPIRIPRDSYRDNFISILDAIDLITSINSMSADQKKSLRRQVEGFDRIEDISENDNPVLVYYKFKDF